MSALTGRYITRKKMKNKYTAAEDHQISGHSLEIYDLMWKNCRLIILFQNGNCFSITSEKNVQFIWNQTKTSNVKYVITSLCLLEGYN